MTYRVEISYTRMDSYGMPCSADGVVYVDASSKREARKLAREKCIIAQLWKPRIGPALES